MIHRVIRWLRAIMHRRQHERTQAYYEAKFIFEAYTGTGLFEGSGGVISKNTALKALGLEEPWTRSSDLSSSSCVSSEQ